MSTQKDDPPKVGIKDFFIAISLIGIVIAVAIVVGWNAVLWGVPDGQAFLIGALAAGVAAFIIAWVAPKSLGRGVSALVGLLG